MPRNNAKSKRIILELLHCPSGSLSKYRIGKDTQTNISWVIEFLKNLEKQRIVKETKVQDVNKLIEHYLSLDAKQKYFDFHIPQPLEYLKAAKKEYLLTTYVAENLLSHHLFPSRTDVYIKEEDVDAWKERLFKKGLIGSGNFRLIIAKDDYLFKFVQEIKKLKVVSLPLLLIDLKREGGVCLEAYNYLVNKYVPR